MQELSDMIGGIAGGLVSGWIIYLLVSAVHRAKVARLQAELQKQLLEKFQSSTELMEFLGSEAGRRFLESPANETMSPYRRILSSVTAGIVLALVGGAFLVIRGQVPDGEQGLTVLGVLLGALGLGFVLAAAVSYVLAKAWGLVGGRAETAGPVH